MSSSVSSTSTFTGQSSFASSLQAALTRAVSIASLPMQHLQADINTLQSQQTALNSLESTFNSLQNSIVSLAAATQGTVTASSSDYSAVTASASSGAMPGTYSITVDRLGSPATAMSNAGSTTITDPTTQNIGTGSSFTLSVDGEGYSITPSANNLQALAEAINDSGAPVQATIVNVGGSSPDYRLALTSTDFSVQNIQLNDGSSDLIATLNGGTTAQYRVAGHTGEIEANSNQVTLAPGLTVNLVDTTSSAVTVTVANNYSQLSTALSNLATTYNAAVDAVSGQIGQNAGALSGQSVVYSLLNMLSGIVQYTGATGGVDSLADLGLNLDQTGHLTFDSTTFANASTTDVQSFLGGITSGGFLQSANTALNSFTDSTTGAIHLGFTSLQDEVDRDNQQISDEQDRIDTLQTNLQARLAAADAAIAALESQKSYMQQLFQAMYPASSSSA